MDSQTDLLTKVSQSVIANQIAMNFNQEIKFTEYYKGSLKAKILPLQLELIKAERTEFEKIFKTVEGTTVDVYSIMAEMVTEIAKLGLMHSGTITEILKAFQKDPKSIQGIVNKINR